MKKINDIFVVALLIVGGLMILACVDTYNGWYGYIGIISLMLAVVLHDEMKIQWGVRTYNKD